MHVPRFRLRTLMIAVLVISLDLASFVMLFRPIDGMFQDQGRPIRTRVVMAAIIGGTLTVAYSVACALFVLIVRRARALRSHLRRSAADWRR